MSRIVRPMGSGLFCVFEGIDGSGKSTLQQQAGRICREGEEGAQIRGRFTEIALLCEPTGFPTGKEIRRLLKSDEGTSAAEWQRLFIADRAENVNRNILPLLERGVLILQDRYYFSTAAYQGGDPPRLAPMAIMEENRLMGFPEPDLLFYLEIDPDLALSRIAGSRGEREVFERKETLQRIAANYEQILPSATIRLDATRSPEELVHMVLRTIPRAEL